MASRTYILIPNHKTQCNGVVDIVTEKWEADGTWVIGERNQSTGSIAFYSGSYGSLEGACLAYDLDVLEVRKRWIRPTAKSEPVAV